MSHGGSADSMLRFQLEIAGDRTKHFRKIKWRQRALLGSMGRNRDMTRRCSDVSWRRGGTGERKGR
jgi:hypothetical protein